MKTMAYWVGLILVGLSYGKPSTLFVITVLITFGVLFLIVIFFAVSSARVRVYMICLIIGCQIIFYGLREIQSGRWTGVILVLLGPVIPYLGYRSRERIEEMMKKRAEKDQRRERDEKTLRLENILLWTECMGGIYLSLFTNGQVSSKLPQNRCL